MKYIRCINNGGREDYLTIGKIYKIYHKNDKFYSIVDDQKTQNNYFRERFEVVDRELKLERILNDSLM